MLLKEIERMKVRKHFSPRSDQICSSALCNGIVRCVDMKAVGEKLI